jgi:hypothetical protein
MGFPHFNNSTHCIQNKIQLKMDHQTSKETESHTSVEEEQAMAVSSSDSKKICYTRYNSPFWQIVIVSFVAFG